MGRLALRAAPWLGQKTVATVLGRSTLTRALTSIPPDGALLCLKTY
jgi:hypothetical protein